MKKISTYNKQKLETDDMLPEYHFDYKKSSPNRFADQIKRDKIVVILDQDISEVFTSSESVNNVLRALITNMPKVT